MNLLSVIIPCYNEALVVRETYKRLHAVFSTQPYKVEFIFLNNRSEDNTFSILKELASKDPCVKVINMSKNFGHQGSVTCGINHCSGDVAAVIDADLQDPPEAILEMLKIMEHEQANVVYGVRKVRKGENWFKLTTAKLFYRTLNRMSDTKFPVDTGDFRIIDRKVIQAFNGFKEKNKYVRGLISWMGFKQVPYYYERQERFAGETKYPLKDMLKFAAIGMFYFSKKPLKIATFTGFLAVLAGVFYAFLVLIAKLFSSDIAVSGWTSTIILIVFFGGVQLLTIGVLGQYIGNLFDEAKNRPEYIIDEKINF
ncbi:MAG: glycosyltransferase family 2 protein [Bacteroidales bacterium]|jgi:dolichol-phosphate mannosyltransferase|nr:glycosyltransferase family 2 protein [Bacteroidales bacterium]